MWMKVESPGLPDLSGFSGLENGAAGILMTK